jgi:hypothetical protein
MKKDTKQIISTRKLFGSPLILCNHVDRVREPSESFGFGGSRISGPPKDTDNYPNNTSGSDSCHHGYAGAGMDRIFCMDGYWMLKPNRPLTESRLRPPSHAMIGLHPVDIAPNETIQKQGNKTGNGSPSRG